ncbi:MAG: hypothetical protein MUP98_04415 [Candidatus Aminicenantes bacterium]|nr:hypothetical protein [Candidatus Aminicenantes bacterium]
MEEEIPGDKIVDEDDDDDDEKEGKASGPIEKKSDESVDFQEDEVIQELVMDTVEEKEASDDSQLQEQEVSNEDLELEEEIDLEEEWSEEKIHKEESAELSLEGIDEEKVIKEREKEIPSDSSEEILKMEDLEKTLESSEIEKQNIDEFINSIRRDQGKDIVSIPFPKQPIEDFVQRESEKPDVPDFVPHPEESQIIEDPLQDEPVFEEEFREHPIDDEIRDVNVEDSPLLSPTSPLFEKEFIAPPSDDLPAWASKINNDPPSNIPMTEEEKEFVTQEKPPTLDTGMGIPEVVAQKDLPFSGETLEVKEEKPEDPPSQLLIWIKSRVFDVLFIGAVWFITIWIASSVMDVKLFKLISAAALLLMVFYVVLLSAYLFLFFFFLGETLGDYLLSPNRGSGFNRLS